MKSKRAAVLITAGVLCLAGALGLTVKNIFDEERAAASADVGVEELREIIPKKETEKLKLEIPPYILLRVWERFIADLQKQLIIAF